MLRKKLVLVLPSLRLYRSLYKTQLVHELESHFDLSVLISNKEVGFEKSDGVTTFSYNESDGLNRLHRLVLDVETYHFRKKNISYDTRVRMITNLSSTKKLNLLNFTQIKSQYGVLLALLNLPIIHLAICPVLRFLGSRHPGLKSALTLINPEVILCFSGGFYSGIENFLGKHARKNQMPFFLIIDNWDNLSSKSILWEKPGLLGVWGPEMEIDATQLHDIEHARIVHLGSSRLDLEDSQSSLNWIKDFKPYVLFAGTGIQHIDEIEALLESRKALDDLGLDGINIVYRPHPWNLRGDFDNSILTAKESKGIILDMDILENGPESFYNQNSLSHLETLVKNCYFLLAGHSTVIVEALYHGKRVLALTGSSHALFDTSDSWVIYRHMSRIRENAGIHECKSLEFLRETIQELLANEVTSQNLVQQLLPDFPDSYSERVMRALGILIQGNPKSVS